MSDLLPECTIEFPAIPKKFSYIIMCMESSYYDFHQLFDFIEENNLSLLPFMKAGYDLFWKKYEKLGRDGSFTHFIRNCTKNYLGSRNREGLLSEGFKKNKFRIPFMNTIEDFLYVLPFLNERDCKVYEFYCAEDIKELLSILPSFSKKWIDYLRKETFSARPLYEEMQKRLATVLEPEFNALRKAGEEIHYAHFVNKDQIKDNIFLTNFFNIRGNFWWALGYDCFFSPLTTKLSERDWDFFIKEGHRIVKDHFKDFYSEQGLENDT